MSQEMIVEVTPAAADYIHKAAEAQNACGYYLAIVEGGCSGSKYEKGLVKAQPANSKEQVCSNGLKVYIDAESADNLRGMVVDYVTDGLNSQIKLFNPNAKGACGCGNSFMR